MVKFSSTILLLFLASLSQAESDTKSFDVDGFCHGVIRTEIGLSKAACKEKCNASKYCPHSEFISLPLDFGNICASIHATCEMEFPGDEDDISFGDLGSGGSLLFDSGEISGKGSVEIFRSTELECNTTCSGVIDSSICLSRFFDIPLASQLDRCASLKMSASTDFSNLFPIKIIEELKKQLKKKANLDESVDGCFHGVVRTEFGISEDECAAKCEASEYCPLSRLISLPLDIEDVCVTAHAKCDLDIPGEEHDVDFGDLGSGGNIFFDSGELCGQASIMFFPSNELECDSYCSTQNETVCFNQYLDLPSSESFDRCAVVTMTGNSDLSDLIPEDVVEKVKEELSVMANFTSAVNACCHGVVRTELGLSEAACTERCDNSTYCPFSEFISLPLDFGDVCATAHAVCEVDIPGEGKDINLGGLGSGGNIIFDSGELCAGGSIGIFPSTEDVCGAYCSDKNVSVCLSQYIDIPLSESLDRCAALTITGSSNFSSIFPIDILDEIKKELVTRANFTEAANACCHSVVRVENGLSEDECAEKCDISEYCPISEFIPVPLGFGNICLTTHGECKVDLPGDEKDLNLGDLGSGGNIYFDSGEVCGEGSVGIFPTSENECDDYCSEEDQNLCLSRYFDIPFSESLDRCAIVTMEGNANFTNLFPIDILEKLREEISNRTTTIQVANACCEGVLVTGSARSEAECTEKCEASDLCPVSKFIPPVFSFIPGACITTHVMCTADLPGDEFDLKFGGLPKNKFLEVDKKVGPYCAEAEIERSTNANEEECNAKCANNADEEARGKICLNLLFFEAPLDMDQCIILRADFDVPIIPSDIFDLIG